MKKFSYCIQINHQLYQSVFENRKISILNHKMIDILMNIFRNIPLKKTKKTPLFEHITQFARLKNVN